MTAVDHLRETLYREATTEYLNHAKALPVRLPGALTSTAGDAAELRARQDLLRIELQQRGLTQHLGMADALALLATLRDPTTSPWQLLKGRSIEHLQRTRV